MLDHYIILPLFYSHIPCVLHPLRNLLSLLKSPHFIQFLFYKFPRFRSREKSMPSNNTRAGVFLPNEKREMGESSFRVYYGATGAAIPFMWESQPGTPKHPIFDKNDNTVPPLTPPPSYLSSSPSLSLGHVHSNNKSRKSRIFDIILSSLSRKNSHVTPTSSPSSTLSWSTTSSSSSSISSPTRAGGRKIRNKSHRRSISFCSFGAKSSLFDDEEEINSNNKEMCLGVKKKYKGCYSMQDMKNAILSIKGH